MNNTGVTGLTAQNLTLSVRVGYVIPPTQLIWHTTDTCTYIIYISREISIEHPSVGLASLAQLLLLLWINRKKWCFITGARNWLPLWNKGQKSDGRLQIWCSIQVCLHRESPEVRLVKKLTGSLYWWVEQCVPTLHIFNRFQYSWKVSCLDRYVVFFCSKIQIYSARDLNKLWRCLHTSSRS